MKKLIPFLFLFACVFAHATPPTSLGKSKDNFERFIAHQNSTKNSVLFALLTRWSDGNTWISYHVATCDGKMISESFGFNTFETYDAALRSLATNGTNHESAAYFNKTSDHFLSKNPIFKTQINKYCQLKLAEKRNFYFPFSESDYDKDKIKDVYSLVMGTSRRAKPNIEAWVEVRKVKQLVMLDSNNQPRKNSEGENIMYDEIQPDLGKTSIKYSVNCGSMTYAILSEVEFDKYGSSINGVNIDKPKFIHPVPNTINETVVNTFCQLYM
jgi:hypothetical protein